MKQITIYELLPLLKKGWVAMNKDKSWNWFNDCPKNEYPWQGWYGRIGTQETSLCCFNIEPFGGDWKDSLINVEDYQKDTNKLADSNSKNRVYKKGVEE